MTVQFACNASEPVTYEFRRPKCPRCGSVMLIAEASAFNLRGRIRRAWSCDDCAHEFVTSMPCGRVSPFGSWPLFASVFEFASVLVRVGLSNIVSCAHCRRIRAQP